MHAHRTHTQMMQKKYVSHYSNKNGQFILRNVQILCIIYITFPASVYVFFVRLLWSALLLIPHDVCVLLPHTFFYYSHTQRQTHTLAHSHTYVWNIHYVLFISFSCSAFTLAAENSFFSALLSAYTRMYPYPYMHTWILFLLFDAENDAYRCACCLLCLQFFSSFVFFYDNNKKIWRERVREEGGDGENKMRSNTHDVILSSFICVFCADAWSLQWFHFFFKWVSVMLLLPLHMPTVCVWNIRSMCMCTVFAGHLFFLAPLPRPQFLHINCVHVWKNIPYYINIF